ncbi:MAG TPA: tRNA-binding protein [Sphingobacteriaceae bacterium]|nr:tRNA-binding protein [Sphingobacteriaceae bacterium]
MDLINWNDFEKVELRTGTILEVLEFPNAHKPAFKLKIDFGNFGIKWSSAQITKNYNPANLIGKQIIAVINFHEKQIANFISECLVTGFEDVNGNIVLPTVGEQVPNGSKLI